MISILESLDLGTLFVLNIISIVIIGILIFAYFKEKGDKKGIMHFLILFMLATIYLLIDFFNFQEIINFYIGNTILIFLILGAYTYTIIKFWKKLNKSLLLGVLILSINFIAWTLLEVFNPAIYNNLFHNLSGISMSLISYFLIIDFIIETSKGYKIKRKKKGKFKLKKRIFLPIILVAIILIISAVFFIPKFIPQKIPEHTGELIIYNRETNLDKDDKLIDDFEKEFGINVTYKTYKEQYILFEELKNKAGDYDLVVLVDAFIGEGMRLDLFEELNKRNIPNLKKYEGFPHDIYNDYSTPYMTGSIGLIINTKYIPEDTDSWEILWDSKYDGKIATFNNPAEAFAMALKNIGYSLNSNNPSEIREAYKYLEYQKYANVKRLEHKAIYELMQSEELWAAEEYSGSGSQLQSEADYFKYIIPKEGSLIALDNFAIPKNAKNKVAAEIFMNFMLRPENAARVADNIKHPVSQFTPNELATVKLLTYTEEELARMEWMDFSKSKDVNELKAKLWEELRS